MSKNAKLPLLFWSGGLDSTYLVYDLLNRGYNIDVAYVRLENNKEKSEHELASIEKLKELMSNLDGSIRNSYIYDIPTLIGNPTGAQSLIWLFSSFLLFDDNKHCDIRVGWIDGDSVWHHKKDIDNVLKSLNDVYRNNTKIVLRHDLEWFTKHEIIERFHDTALGKKIYKSIWYCEDISSKKACGKCTPCKTHRMHKMIFDEGL